MDTALQTAPTVYGVGADNYTLTIPARVFVGVVKATATAVGTDTTLPAFMHASWSVFGDGGFEVAVTDRYRLAVATCGTGSATVVSAAILPVKALLTFAKGIKIPARGRVDDVTVSFTVDMVSVVCGGASLSWLRTDLLDVDQFPNYRKLLSNSYEVGDCSVSRWNPSFLADGADACRYVSAGKNVPMRLELADGRKPARMTPDTLLDGLSRFVYLLMPMRVG